MSQSHIEKNKALVLEAFDTLFNPTATLVEHGLLSQRFTGT